MIKAVLEKRGVGDLGLDPRKCPKPTVIIIAKKTIRLVGGEKAKEKGITTLIAWVKGDSVEATTHEVKPLNYLNSILAMEIQAQLQSF